MKIHKWEDIDDFTEGLILGNGASIAFDKKFSYESLFEEAQLTSEISLIFEYLKTTDFERVLKYLWHARKINSALQIPDTKTKKAYKKIQNALIKVVQQIHSSYEEVSDKLPVAAQFMKHFSKVVSLNYDLLVYWALMLENSYSKNNLKDCFKNGKFQYNWKQF